MISETILALTLLTSEPLEPAINSTEIVFELQSNRSQFFIAQAANKDKPKPRFQTIEIPDGYILCPVNYVCIPKEQYSGQPMVPSTVNQAPQATITNPNPNQPPSQNINQINPNSNLNPGIGQINNQPNQNQFPGGNYPNQNQGINSPIGQSGGIGINQQNVGIGPGGFNNGGNERGRINTTVNLNLGIGVSVSF
jgi:hypothetical protein